jgi:hypothetical protein
MAHFIFKVFFQSWTILCLLLVITTINNKESNLETILFISFVASCFNTIFIVSFDKLRFSDFRNWSKVVMFIEIIIYFILITSIEKAVLILDFVKGNNMFFDFPFTFIYPFTVLFFVCYAYKKTINMQIDSDSNILDD